MSVVHLVMLQPINNGRRLVVRCVGIAVAGVHAERRCPVRPDNLLDRMFGPLLVCSIHALSSK